MILKYHRRCQTHNVLRIEQLIFMIYLYGFGPARFKLWGKWRKRRHLEAKGLTVDHVLNLYLVCLHRMAAHVLQLCARLRKKEPDTWNIGNHIYGRGNASCQGALENLSNFHYFALRTLSASIQLFTQNTSSLTKRDRFAPRSVSPCFSVNQRLESVLVTCKEQSRNTCRREVLN